ncbi:NADPH-dependent FMN reductase family protein [Nitrogeniibacter aestuarii]|uniref:hypothetical protein n=1 Tax=Nitrogeniibacter aestuarii TaxID=2815343 RepID=UPI001E42CC7A|nr:hypothetical protein [Nitrogeniibacter aestuarii]
MTYVFEHSNARLGARFVGLVLDPRTQRMHTDERLERRSTMGAPQRMGLPALAPR